MTFTDKVRKIFNVRGNSARQPGQRKHMLGDSIRNILVVVFGEFCGTFMFLMLSFAGAQTAINNNQPNIPGAPLAPASLLYIACSFGTAIAVNVWVFYRVTGGMFNPAVSQVKSSQVDSVRFGGHGPFVHPHSLNAIPNTHHTHAPNVLVFLTRDVLDTHH